jgi:hypothetical protein
MDTSKEDQAKNQETFFSSLREAMEKFDITLDHLYNADQTGLFYNKLPNSVYIYEDQQDYRSVKQMKRKDQVMLMVASSASGKKVPLFMAGKSKNPECFKLCGRVPLMAYTYQLNAWFDRDVTMHWIITVLWPWHLQQHGNIMLVIT